MNIVVAIVNCLHHVLSLSWLTGPIFDKELRVSSRRRRNYVLRFAYMSFLTFLLAMFWIQASRQGGSGLFLMSRMAKTGKTMIACTVLFQFCVTQIIAVIMLSASISGEVYRRTLGLLMTTPITSFQIVMGKLFGKLLQLLLLLAISLPLLAVVRVFGGVPWDYVISSLCITLTAAIFVGSLSLFFSIFTRKSYVVIIITFLTLGFLFALMPLGVYSVWDVTAGVPAQAEKNLIGGLFLPNPYCNMFMNTIIMENPRGAIGMPTFIWPLHCGIMLAASVLILFLATISVRRVALRQATGQLEKPPRRRRSGRNAAGPSRDSEDSAAAIRRVAGPAILWKEMRLPLLGRRKRSTYLAIGAGLAIILGSYYLCHLQHVLREAEIHIVYAIVYMGLGTLFTVVIPCTCITAEKEARSWPLLLVTTLDDRDILLGKLTGTLRRCFPVWMLLLGHIVVFSLAGMIHPLAIVHVSILAFWLVFFLSCSGLYFSSRFKSTTAAVITNFTFALAIWAIVPLLLALVTNVTHQSDIVEAYMDTNPLTHIGVIMDATAGSHALDSYNWLRAGSTDAFAATVWMLTCAGGYVLLGAIFAWRAQRRFRRNIF
jgi:ABC-type transport system involved in multi-copper enzyme maturation permease subunit